MPENDPWVRAKDKSTGIPQSVRQSVIDNNPDAWQPLKREAVNHHGDPIPPDYAAVSGSASSGQPKAGSADTSPNKESD